MTAEGWVAMRPEGIRGCTGHDHPVLLLREVGGANGILVRLDEGEALHLSGVFGGARSRRGRTYETLEQAISGLGGTVMTLRLVGNRRRGLDGEIEIAGDSWRQVVVRAHPGDVAALAWRLQVEVQVPSELTTQETGACREWWPAPTSETGPAIADALRSAIGGADPEDFDW